MTHLIAQPDDIVTCERGHPLYRITETIYRTSIFRAKQFERINPRAQEPIKYYAIRPCYCGAIWYRSLGLNIGRRVHFEEGWRP